jgi:hypothetical protein
MHSTDRLLAGWFQPLPEERQRLFNCQTADWEHGYAMFSITLRSALSAFSHGELIHARQQVACASELALRLSARLIPTLAALQGTRQWRRTPAVAPLQPDLFRRASTQQAAVWNSALHWPLLLRRWQFALKLRALRQALGVITGEFCELAEELAQGISVHPASAWRALEALHDDFNTVLREAFVVLKAFLCAVSAEGYRLFLAALGEAKGKSLLAQGDIIPARP